ncbi:MAG: glutamine synthetase family protein [Parvibaculales bacterium]
MSKAVLENIKQGKLDTIIICAPDMQGRLVGKRVTGKHFLEHARHETHGCNYLLTADMEMEPVPGYKHANWQDGYGDFIFVPDMKTLREIPWQKNTGLVLCNWINEKKKAIEVAPRRILKKQIARLKSKGFLCNIASELEFFLFKQSFEQAATQAYRNLKPNGWYIQDYHIFHTSKEEEYMRNLRNGLMGANIEVEGTKGEWAHGQSEINLRFQNPLTMADSHVITKNAAKEIAWQYGQAVTFMAKWSEKQAGNSCHIHLSLTDEKGKNLFYMPKGKNNMSEICQNFLAGMMMYSRDILLFLAPYVNSYKRFVEGSFAPTAIAWSHDNRTTSFRQITQKEASRIECRIAGGDVNPYLAYSLLMASGLAGIEQKLPLPKEYRGNAYEDDRIDKLPKSLYEAINLAERSSFLRDVLGEDVLEHYLHAAKWEQKQYNAHISDWEIKRGFERG